jgi:hypothetical protein
MKILFLHGWRSVPGGVKPTYLVQHVLFSGDTDLSIRTGAKVPKTLE